MAQWKWGMKHGCHPGKRRQITARPRNRQAAARRWPWRRWHWVELFVNNQSICQCNEVQQISAGTSFCLWPSAGENKTVLELQEAQKLMYCESVYMVKNFSLSINIPPVARKKHKYIYFLQYFYFLCQQNQKSEVKKSQNGCVASLKPHQLSSRESSSQKSSQVEDYYNYWLSLLTVYILDLQEQTGNALTSTHPWSYAGIP